MHREIVGLSIHEERGETLRNSSRIHWQTVGLYLCPAPFIPQEPRALPLPVDADTLWAVPWPWPAWQRGLTGVAAGRSRFQVRPSPR